MDVLNACRDEIESINSQTDLISKYLLCNALRRRLGKELPPEDDIPAEIKLLECNALVELWLISEPKDCPASRFLIFPRPRLATP